ncbi:MAG: exodeoxyribonuclease VII small subunit [Erysipelotrichaceae bacterium]|jgi:exodeoxyribonuclease VII small subunit|uniref:Exodeoxyribonuclease 7 small subunit n=1 Tax=Grylomicrobium aquisgranensis TaxID=2926318 RepID=A0AB35U3T4_9FIRM|nr:exodeoxyribonuclease VII small subunit [Lactimicrobium massiliense]MCH4020088.1 exodeoxyribonuclease VII small subunit [Erysipelotrichaceae bacterium]MCI1325810.1 exodeoxyribonuclease VII small subunit [Solobacterium sp.]MDX8420155.1 exodeoxyribonuclease VII small subunit [Stecheria sp. CLA-KB-P133]MCH4044917.1 exodeoxyribonuclease VII small subunit [Erysipelotrichaceae bacterium]MCH4122129.1 exodeoxyribonuclease VII small subunit [Erysipelotrichaceae bacterium]
MAAKKLTFEESMARLEEIVSALEQNDAPLDQTVAMFEEGLKLVKSCDASLKQFESKVNEIVKENGGEQNE